MARILIAEDDTYLRDMIIVALRREHHSPDAVGTARAARERLCQQEYDLAIIDWGFLGEELTGLDLIRQIAQQPQPIPTLMLTGRSSLIDRVTGLSCGADDYLVKPFHLPELLARINALLRRGRRPIKSEIVMAGPLRLNTTAHTVVLNGKSLNFNNREFQLLQFIVEKDGVLAKRSEILEKVWGDVEARHNSNTIDVHVQRIRRKLGAASKLITTVRGVGFRFQAP